MKKIKNVVVIGAGKSGRGYVGELLYDEGIDITYVDVDKELVEKMRDQKYYTVYKYDDHGHEEIVVVDKYQVLHPLSQHEEYLEAMEKADLIMTAVFPDAFEQLAKDFTELLRRNMDRQRDKRIVITLGSNYVGLKEKYDVLMRMFLNENEIEYYKKYFLFVESIILRVSSMPTVEQEMKDKLSIQGGNRPTLQVNRCITEAFRSEELPDFFILEEDTLKIMRLKIWKANTLHCSLAFMGKYYGKQFIYECARDDQISKYAFYASEEGDNALAKLYGASTKYSEADLTDTWKSYQDDNLQDFVDRVGADPIRKLSRNERFIGPALLCMKYHIFPYFICKCAAYGFFYSDKTNGDIVSKVKEEGIEKTIETVCGLNLMEQNEKLIYDMILHSYYEILQENPVRKLTCK